MQMQLEAAVFTRVTAPQEEEEEEGNGPTYLWRQMSLTSKVNFLNVNSAIFS